MLRRYLDHPLSGADTLAAECGFTLSVGGARLHGVVDRVCRLDGRTALVDYKTNARLDERLLEAYSTQLRIYGLAAARGLLPGGSETALIIFDLRAARTIEVSPDPDAVTRHVERVAARIAGGDFSIGPEHTDRPCRLCAFRAACPSARR
jgi:formylmethanofuran dehydrogenase subunit A